MDIRYGLDSLKQVILSLANVFKTIPRDNDLEMIIEMIKDDVTFDDPGLFLRQSIKDETEKLTQEGAVLWLIHQFMYLVSCDNYVKSKLKILEIQKLLLSACHTKQRWLFLKLIEKYANFTIQLASVDFSLKQPFIVDMFQFEKLNELSLIPTEYPVRTITIKDIETLHLFAMDNIKILTHGLTLIADDALKRKCTEAVLQSFDVMDFRVKTLSLDFLVQQTVNSDSEYCRIITRILLEHFDTLDSQIRQCNIQNAFPEFVKILMKFLSNDERQTEFCRLTEDCSRIFNFCFGLIERNIGETQSRDYDNLMACTYRRLENILVKHITSSQIMKVKSFVVDKRNITKHSLRLMKFCVFEECKTIGSAYTWDFGCSQAEEILNRLERAETSNEMTGEMNLFADLLEITLQIQYDFIAWHQRQHMKNSNLNVCDTCSHTHYGCQKIVLSDRVVTVPVVYPTLLSNLQLLAETFLRIVKKKKELMRLDVSNVAIMLLSFWNSKEMDDVIDSLLTLSMCVFGFYDRIKKFNVEFSHAIAQPGDMLTSLRRLFTVNITWDDYMTSVVYQMLLTENYLCNLGSILIIQRLNNPNDVLSDLLKRSVKGPTFDLNLSESIRTLICLTSHNCNALLDIDNGYQYSVVCNICDCNIKIDEQLNGVVLPVEFNDDHTLSSENMEEILMLFQSNESRIRFNMVDCLPVISTRHSYVLCSAQNLFWTNLFNDDLLEIKIGLTKVVQRVVDTIQNSNVDKELKDKTIQLCLDKLLAATKKSLRTDDKNEQACIVELIGKFASCKTSSERTLLMCFRKLIFYLMNPKSSVVANATLCAETICRSKGIKPKHLYSWYKENILNVVISLAVSVRLEYGLLLDKTLCNFNEMLGYTNLKRELIKNDFAMITAMVLPYAVKYPACEALLDNICTLTNLYLDLLLKRAFIQIYVYLNLRETPPVTEKCLAFITQKTGESVSSFLKRDSKRLLSEVLLSYHKNPEFATNTIHILISKQETAMNEKSFDKITKYLDERFLGVLNSFGTILMTTNFEKNLQKQALLSLGDIIRFLGIKITQYRFKILELLNSVRMLNDIELTNICVDVWRIFIYTVDICKMGPLLSTTLVLLEPLLETHADRVNEILKFLIISNGSQINPYISDLFFLEMTSVSDEIKNFVAEQSEKLQMDDTFIKKLKLYSKQINENVANVGVRIYGLNYLSDLFCQSRKELNNLILGHERIDPIIVDLLENLLEGCRHVDENLHIPSAICLGQLGAIEPSLLPRNYAPQSHFAFNIHSDSFSIMALNQLCLAYQTQKNTHDVFSLAIQEILVTKGVDPNRNKKMNIWNSIPEKLQSLMKPFLTSSYTSLDNNVKMNIHPIFGSTHCLNLEYWAYNWAINMMSMITDEATKSLLTSIKPSMKNHTGILLLFLPYVLVHALKCATSEDINKLKEEFQCVFNAVLYPSENDSTDGLCMKCAKIAINQLEFLNRWICCYHNSKEANLNDREYLTLLNFLTFFHQKQLAEVNFKCGEYAKALMSLELYVQSDPRQLQSELTFFLQIYAELADIDSMEGALALKVNQPTFAEQILFNNMTGRLQESTVVFEKMMQVGDITEANVNDIIQCYLGLDQPETALRVTESLMNQFYDKNINSLLIAKSEPLWRLGRFEELEELIESEDIRDSPNWGVQCGQVLLNFTKAQFDEYATALKNCRMCMIKELQTIGDGKNDYNSSYPFVMKLHLITEMESVHEMFNEFVSKQDVNTSTSALQILFNIWDARLEFMQPTARIIEPVLCLRRILLTETKKLFRLHVKNETIIRNGEKLIDEYIGESLIKSIELARKAEMYQQAKLFILNAEAYSPPRLFIEKAKLDWVKGDQNSCFHILNRGIEEMDELKIKQLHPLVYGEAKFLYANYSAESKNTNPSVNQNHFKSAIQELKTSEECFVCMAQYQDQIFAAMPDSEKQSRQGYELQQEIISHYGKSMIYGCKYIFQSMPRFLSIWLDFYNYNKDESHKSVAKKINSVVERFSQRLPAFVFFTAFSQLVSRISHPSSDVYQIIKTIIIKLILQFPQQSLWMILMVYKSTYTNRVKRCAEIFSDKRLASKNIQKLIQDFNSLVDILITLTNKDLSKTMNKFLVTDVCSALPKLLLDSNRSQILFPSEKLMKPVLPAPCERQKIELDYDCFPHESVYIHGVRNEMIILPSLQRPKRITLIGSNGKDYMIMMKPRDDLRKDFRLMEFNAVVKQYLHQELESRQRRLNIRTYAVIPLNEDCGIIEWIPNLHALRTIITGVLKRSNSSMSSRERQALMCHKNDTIETKRKAFNELKSRHPPVFREWFVENFTTPQNWYEARNSFVRTTAVMSMVGYILGLGDRHGENILFDATTGDTVHVDFNCLFNKGEQFEFPELVPFRLTHNLVNAMGPLGVEGMFRKCCEITLKVLQQQKPILMSVLKPFVYDPLVEWNRTNSSISNGTERTDPQAMNNVNRIEQRLSGLIKSNGSNVSNIPLSVEGVVKHCILEATDTDRLASMFFGWAAYL